MWYYGIYFVFALTSPVKDFAGPSPAMTGKEEVVG